MPHSSHLVLTCGEDQVQWQSTWSQPWVLREGAGLHAPLLVSLCRSCPRSRWRLQNCPRGTQAWDADASTQSRSQETLGYTIPFSFSLGLSCSISTTGRNNSESRRSKDHSQFRVTCHVISTSDLTGKKPKHLQSDPTLLPDFR